MKKTIALFLAMLMCTSSASAFTFPPPDWGALLAEKTAMVSETDFELYTEGPVDSAPYYGAKFEPVGGTYFGMVTENSAFLHPIGGYLTYFDLDSWQTDIYYPANNMIRDGNALTTVAFNIGSLNNVNYEVIRQALDNLASYNKPMLIRFANEMNVSSLGDDPDRYVSIFRDVANIIHNEYPQFGVIWSPNDLGALDRPFEYFYPGDEYVDWIGVSAYEKMYFVGNQNTDDKDARYFMTGDYAWTTNAVKPIIEFMKKNNINKPLMLSECGISTNTIHGSDQAWSEPRFRNLYFNTIMKYPQIKIINYFNVNRSEKETYDVADIQNGIPHKEYAKAIMEEALNSGAYIRGYNENPEFVFAPASDSHTLSAKDGIVNLYTLAYIPKTPNISVNYTVDGQWYHSTGSAPYKCGLNISAMADGAHTVEISASGLSKAYTFYKKGNSICFGKEPPAPAINVTVNGELLQFDSQPVAISGRVLVPVRAIFNALGVEIDWNNEEQTAYAYGRGHEISIGLNSDVFYKDGAEIPLDVPAQAINNRILVPTRAISEALDCDVAWDGATNTVVITY